MLPQLSSLARSAVIALAALASLSPAANGAPIGPVLDPSVAAGSADNAIPVEMGGPGYGRAVPNAYLRYPRRWGGNWGGGGRYWNRGNWGGGRYWDGGGRYHRWGHGHYYRNGWNNWGGFALGLGLGIPLGYYGSGYYGGYDPYYAPYRPRVYRGGGSAHVEWCYARYRSYRPYDNTYQPYHGPRRQCLSPYG